VATSRVLIVVLDGLRPDLVTEERMPFVHSLAAEGTRLTRYAAAYPPHTRVQVATMCTGTYPGQHGIVSNVMVLEEAGEDGILDTSDFRQIAELDRRTQGRAILRPPLADLLAARGQRLAVAASGSTGSSWLWARTQPFRLVNPRSVFGLPDLAALREKLGPPPDPTDSSLELVRYAIRAARDLFLPDPDIAVTVLWLHEPDATFHFAGLGSPESESVLRQLDELLARFFDHLAARRLLDDLLVFVLSDHGQSTPLHHRSLSELLRQAPPLPVLDRLVPAGDFLFRRPGSTTPKPAELAPLIEWLLEQPWVGAVLAHPSLTSARPGTAALTAVWGGSLERDALERLPLLAVSPTWRADQNEFGVAGVVTALTEQVALRSTHGSGSPFELQAFAVMLGPNIRKGFASRIPAGVVDIVPTVAAVLGLTPEQPFAGRVLQEAFDESWQPSIRSELCRPTPGAIVLGWRTEGTFYLDRIAGPDQFWDDRSG